MKNRFCLSMCFSFFLCLKAYSTEFHLTPGTYELKGSNPGSTQVNYRGEVIIRPYGSNYLLTWKIGSSQQQTGIGILRDHVLSVAYCGIPNGDWGVVSYYFTAPDQLEGSWTGYNSPIAGKEWLTFKYGLPTEHRLPQGSP